MGVAFTQSTRQYTRVDTRINTFLPARLLAIQYRCALDVAPLWHMTSAQSPPHTDHMDMPQKWLSIAGVSLDAKNDHVSSEYGETTRLPFFRTTGVNLRIISTIEKCAASTAQDARQSSWTIVPGFATPPTPFAK